MAKDVQLRGCKLRYARFADIPVRRYNRIYMKGVYK